MAAAAFNRNKAEVGRKKIHGHERVVQTRKDERNRKFLRLLKADDGNLTRGLAVS